MPPPPPDEFIACLENDIPLSCIYNAIVWSTNPRRLKNENAYVETSSYQQAERVAAVAQCWEGLITKKRSPTAAALILTLHHRTGSKKATSLLHKCEWEFLMLMFDFLQTPGLKTFL